MSTATLNAPLTDLRDEILALKKEKDATILAHYYQEGEIQELADYTGDSLQLARAATKVDTPTIVFCGVHFMAESAKILNPGKTVLLPNLSAGCALADSITPESLLKWKERYPGYLVVTYINSSAEVKALSDICCTSANAVSVIRSLPTDRILCAMTTAPGCPDFTLSTLASRRTSCVGQAPS